MAVRALYESGDLSPSDVVILERSAPYVDYVWAVQPRMRADIRRRISEALLMLDPLEEEDAEILSLQMCGGYVPARLAEFDVLLAPYRRAVLVGDKAVDVARWMSPLKVFEGMAAGKALVASDLPALREFLRDGENAVLARPDDEEHWVECLTRLERDPELRARLGAAARAEFLAEYTWDARARRLLEQEAAWTRS